MNRHYVGKDLVHYGSAIVLDPDQAYAALDHSARKNIRKAENAGFDIQRCSGTARELDALRALWYCPDDPNFPAELAAGQILYLAYLDGELAGGMVLIPVGRHLFLNNLTASESGKRHQLQGYLLWHAVGDLWDSGFQYIDIGVSYRVNLQRFFTKWASFRYPVIFNVPELKPDIRFRPFRQLPNVSAGSADGDVLARVFGTNAVTLVPSIEFARRIADKHGGIWIETRNPKAIGGNRLLDLTELFPVQYGAAVLGVALSPETLWEEYGCYDHFKQQYLMNCLTLPGWNIDSIAVRRAENQQRFQACFEREDLQIEDCSDWVDGFTFRSADSARLACRFTKFGVEVRCSGDRLTLPCHQELSEQDIEYLHAIYRGHLNLCSEWGPTGVKGSIKLTGS
jgi:Acetyltransferase (GNAT) domain